MHRSRIALAGALAALVLGVGACGGDDEGGGGGGGSGGGDGDPVKVGYIVSRTGPAAADAERDIAGAQIAVEEINAAGGADGRPIELIIRDDRTDPTVAAREARDLVLSEEVDMLAGATVSAVAAAIKEVATSTKVPYLISTANAAQLTEDDPSPYTFRSWSNSRVMPGPVADYAAKQPWKRYAMVVGNNDFGIGISDSFEKYVKDANPDAEFVERIMVEQGATDYSAAVNQLRSLKPDAIFMGGVFGASYIAFAKQAVPAGIYKDAHVMSFMGEADLEAVGKLVPAGKQIGFNAFYSTYDDPFAQEFSQKVQDATGELADGSNFVGYMTAQWVKQAVERGGGAGREEIAKGLAGAEMDTFIGPVTIRPGDHEATGSYFYGVVDEDDSGEVAFTEVGTVPGTEFLPPDTGE